MLKRTDFQIDGRNFLELNGGVINEAIQNKNNTDFIFRDSCRIFAGGLDGLCRDLKPMHMKLSGKVDFNRWNSENVFTEFRSNIEVYLKHDCLSLAEIMISFREKLLADKSIEIDICDCYTAATLAKKLYF